MNSDAGSNADPGQGIPQGIRHIRLSMPFRLDHINVYLLEDTDGGVLVDTGLASDESKIAWATLLDEMEESHTPLRTIVVTHMHPDHLGMAAWLQERTGAPVYVTKAEWAMARALWDPTLEDTARWREYLAKLGLPSALERTLRGGIGGYRKLVPKLPDRVASLAEGMKFPIGNREWQVVVGRGHSPEHACLWCASERILLSGDHVLPGITPNIGLMHIGPRNPLCDYLDSLVRFERLDPAWILPAHGRPMRQPITRMAELRHHHIRQLAKLSRFCRLPRTAYQCARALFDRDLSTHELVFALRETLAHLVYLETQRQMVVAEKEGIPRYQSSARPEQDLVREAV
jgi:glyoxylase-like metal-dependent hydrolase (beta-lactamase superfamily II)